MAWIRLDCAMVAGGWTAGLSAAAFAAWVKLLLETKQFHPGGRVRLSRVGAEWRRQKRIPKGAWDAMLKAAQDDGAVVVEDGALCVVNWSTYQRDPSNVERQRRHRKKRGSRPKKEPVTLRNGRNDTTETVDTDNDRDKDNGTSAVEQVTAAEPPSSSVQKKAVCTADNNGARAEGDGGPAVRNPRCQALADAIHQHMSKPNGTIESHQRDAVLAGCSAVGWTADQVLDVRRRHDDQEILRAMRYTIHHNAISPGGYLRECLRNGHHQIAERRDRHGKA